MTEGNPEIKLEEGELEDGEIEDDDDDDVRPASPKEERASPPLKTETGSKEKGDSDSDDSARRKRKERHKKKKEERKKRKREKEERREKSSKHSPRQSPRRQESPRHESPRRSSPKGSDDDDNADDSKSGGKSLTDIPSLMELAVAPPAASASTSASILPLPTPDVKPLAPAVNVAPAKISRSPKRRSSPVQGFNDPYDSPGGSDNGSFDPRNSPIRYNEYRQDPQMPSRDPPSPRYESSTAYPQRSPQMTGFGSPRRYESPYHSPSPNPYDSPPFSDSRHFGYDSEDERSMDRPTQPLDSPNLGGPSKGTKRKRELEGRLRHSPERDRERDRLRKKSKKSDAPCKYWLEGICDKTEDECPFAHSGSVDKKPEMCKFYLNSNCAKGKACIFMHEEYPCKFFHLGMTCFSGSDCKFSHAPLDDVTHPMIEKLRKRKGESDLEYKQRLRDEEEGKLEGGKAILPKEEDPFEDNPFDVADDDAAEGRSYRNEVPPPGNYFVFPAAREAMKIIEQRKLAAMPEEERLKRENANKSEFSSDSRDNDAGRSGDNWNNERMGFDGNQQNQPSGNPNASGGGLDVISMINKIRNEVNTQDNFRGSGNFSGPMGSNMRGRGNFDSSFRFPNDNFNPMPGNEHPGNRDSRFQNNFGMRNFSPNANMMGNFGPNNMAGNMNMIGGMFRPNNPNMGPPNMNTFNNGGFNRGPNMGGQNFGNFNMSGPNMGGPNLGGPNMGGPNMGGANMGGQNMGGLNMGGPNMGGQNMGGPNIGVQNIGGGPFSGGPNIGGASNMDNKPNMASGSNLGIGANMSGNITGQNIYPENMKDFSSDNNFKQDTKINPEVTRPDSQEQSGPGSSNDANLDVKKMETKDQDSDMDASIFFGHEDVDLRQSSDLQLHDVDYRISDSDLRRQSSEDFESKIHQKESFNSDSRAKDPRQTKLYEKDEPSNQNNKLLQASETKARNDPRKASKSHRVQDPRTKDPRSKESQSSSKDPRFTLKENSGSQVNAAAGESEKSSVSLVKSKLKIDSAADKNATRVKADPKSKLKWKLRLFDMDKAVCKVPYEYSKANDPRTKKYKIEMPSLPTINLDAAPASATECLSSSSDSDKSKSSETNYQNKLASKAASMGISPRRQSSSSENVHHHSKPKEKSSSKESVRRLLAIGSAFKTKEKPKVKVEGTKSVADQIKQESRFKGPYGSYVGDATTENRLQEPSQPSPIEKTDNERPLDYKEHIVFSSENNPGKAFHGGLPLVANVSVKKGPLVKKSVSKSSLSRISSSPPVSRTPPANSPPPFEASGADPFNPLSGLSPDIKTSKPSQGKQEWRSEPEITFPSHDQTPEDVMNDPFGTGPSSGHLKDVFETIDPTASPFC